MFKVPDPETFEMSPETLEGLKAFQKEMTDVDELASVLLKAHLLIEGVLSKIIESFFFHPEHLADARLTFNHKMTLARSFCLRKNNAGIWHLIAAVNSLRNELAHNINSPRRIVKIQKLREIFFREAPATSNIEEAKKKDDIIVVMYACALCVGYLTGFESDAKSFREMVHGMDRAMNPDTIPFAL